MTLDCEDIGIKNSEFVAKTHSFKQSKSSPNISIPRILHFLDEERQLWLYKQTFAPFQTYQYYLINKTVKTTIIVFHPPNT